MKRIASLAAAVLLAFLVAGCGGNKGSSAEYPANFKATAADASVILTWTAEPDVDYWIFYGAGDNITTSNWVTAGGKVIVNAVTPATITGLTNGSTYSFTINGRKSGGPGGPGAPTQVAVPRLSGIFWTAGTPLGTADLRGAASGAVPTGRGNVAAGAGGALYASINDGAWAAQTNPTSPRDLNGACFGTLGFLTVGNAGAILYSLDAVTWISEPSNTGSDLYGCAGTGVAGYVVVGAGGLVILGADGSNWTQPTTGTTQNLYAVTAGGGSYVAVGAKGTIIATIDGTTWVAASSQTGFDLRGIAYAAIGDATAGTTTNLYVAVGAAGTVLTSNDGLAWTVQAPIPGADLTGIVYGGQFVATAKGGGIYTSPDGVTWTKQNSTVTTDLAAIARTASGYFAVGPQGTNISSF